MKREQDKPKTLNWEKIEEWENLRIREWLKAENILETFSFRLGQSLFNRV